MGTIKKQRSKFTGPSHPWERTRLEEEKVIKREYGLKNKKEIWKIASELRRLKAQAKNLIRERGKPNYSKDSEIKFLKSLEKYGWVTVDSPLESVLSLTPKELMSRRLQTIVFNKGLALTVNQARQFIVHGHITIDNKKIDIPSYMVSITEENKLQFCQVSSIAKDEHPERAKKNQQKEKIKAAADAKKKAEDEAAAGITEEELKKIEKEVIAEVAV